MPEKVYNVLFVDVGNAARSILAEVALNAEAHGRFRAFSAGCNPHGTVSDQALELARQVGYPVETLRSKHWEEFAAADAPSIDLIITLEDVEHDACCPAWPGQPVTAHWHFNDPAGKGIDAYHHLFRELAERVRFLMVLPDRALDRMALETHVRAIERMSS